MFFVKSASKLIFDFPFKLVNETDLGIALDFVRRQVYANLFFLSLNAKIWTVDSTELNAGLVSAAAPEDEDAVTVEEENVTTDKTAKSATGEPLVPRVSTSFLLPENPFHMVVNGEAVTLLLGFHNRGIPADKLQELSESERESLDQTLQLVGIQGHFTKPGDFDQIIRNVRCDHWFELVY